MSKYPLVLGADKSHLKKEMRFTVKHQTPYHVWTREEMPPILEDILGCVVYLYPSVHEAEHNVKAGGSGFLVAVPSEVEGSHLYAVTNSHVISEGKSRVIRVNLRKGGTDILDLGFDDWTHHPDNDDLAISPIILNLEDHEFTALYIHKMAITKEKIGGKGLWITPGSDVFMCGRFRNHEGEHVNMPSARFGNIAKLPKEPILHARGHLQESYLVEMHSLSGFSGSPVFVFTSKDHVIGDGGDMFFEPHVYEHFLGVDWCHIHYYDEIVDMNGNTHPDGWRVKRNSGMAGVIPAWKLLELIDSEEFIMQRAKEDQQRLKKKQETEAASPVTMDMEMPIIDLNQAGFERVLKKASQKLSEPDQEKKET